MSPWQHMVRSFHERFGLTVGTTLEVRDARLRARLLLEEATEAAVAILSGDVLGAAGELADVVYVALGAAVAFGVDLDPVFRAVHEANMRKSMTLDEGGKVTKPEGWVPPDVEGALR